MKTAQEFVDALNAKFGPQGYSTFEVVEGGRKFTKIAAIHGGQRSVYCFLDADGNVYKAEGWKKPARGIRANLATLDMSRVDWSGGWLYVR